MPAPEPTSPEPPRSRPPRFTIASWIIPAIGGLITFMVYQKGLERHEYDEMMSGLGELYRGAVVSSFATFICGLIAFLRREQNRWLAILPFLISLGILLFFVANYLGHRSAA